MKRMQRRRLGKMSFLDRLAEQHTSQNDLQQGLSPLQPQQPRLGLFVVRFSQRSPCLFEAEMPQWVDFQKALPKKRASARRSIAPEKALSWQIQLAVEQKRPNGR